MGWSHCDPEYDAGGNLIKKRCRRCKEMRSADNDFYRSKSRDGRPLIRAYCKSCWSTVNDRHYRRQKSERRMAEHRAKFIVKDARATDKRRGLHNDLTVEWVGSFIAGGCHYCGETALRMTLDRIDNERGHTRDNVLPACGRCNFARRTMPYAAWLCLVGGMREARERGLFGEWTGMIEREGRTRSALGIKTRKQRVRPNSEI